MTEEQQKFYNKHLDIKFGMEYFGECDDKYIDKIFDNLLKCLPNNGKLYKYKCINNEQDFNNTFDTLANDYLWLSRADTFKDRTDTGINLSIENDVEYIKKIFENNNELIIKYLLKKLIFQYKGIERYNKIVPKIIKYIDIDKPDIKGNEIVSILIEEYKCKVEDAIEFAIKLKNAIIVYTNNRQQVINEIANNFYNFNSNNKRLTYVCSLCENYNVDSMWDYYTDGNGICIEYDYNRITHLSLDIKREFVNTFKVIYNDKNKSKSITKFFESFIRFEGEIEQYKVEDKTLLYDVITKLPAYEKEKEWRIVLHNISKREGVKLYAENIVSSIIIDEKALDTNNGKLILNLCKEKGWDIKVRLLNYVGTHYNYMSYEEYKKLINRSIY